MSVKSLEGTGEKEFTFSTNLVLSKGIAVILGESVGVADGECGPPEKAPSSGNGTVIIHTSSEDVATGGPVGALLYLVRVVLEVGRGELTVEERWPRWLRLGSRFSRLVLYKWHSVRTVLGPVSTQVTQSTPHSVSFPQWTLSPLPAPPTPPLVPRPPGSATPSTLLLLVPLGRNAYQPNRHGNERKACGLGFLAVDIRFE